MIIYTFHAAIVLADAEPRPELVHITITYHDYDTAAYGMRCLDNDLTNIMCDFDSKSVRSCLYEEFAQHVQDNGCDEP